MILLLIIIVSLITILEISHKIRPHSPLRIQGRNFKKKYNDGNLEIEGWIDIHNPHKKMEVMIPELFINYSFIGDQKAIDKEISIHSSIKESIKETHYWTACIVKSRSTTSRQINIKLSSNDILNSDNVPDNIWIEIVWINYGPFGRIERKDGFIYSIRQGKSNKYLFKHQGNSKVLPIKTHLLGSLDKPMDVCIKYTKDLIQPSDILTIGETPLAIMQGRYINPIYISPSLQSKLLCKFFHPTSSLATACGMQTLINIEGPSRILLAWIFGALFKIFGVKGMFYRIAGEQARLIDDLTGTTPPYDKNIVLGPKNSKRVCDEIAQKLGIVVAVVDVNDLGKVKIISSSNENHNKLIKEALINNPAGNANEQTPLVLVRPS